jgi:uncharacterized membrane protein
MPLEAELRPAHNVAFNLFLALIPMALAFFVARGVRRQMHTTGRVRWFAWLPVLLLWLVFLPNTCYLLTEWRHYLQTIATTPLYFQALQGKEALRDLLIVTCFYILYSGLGLLTFFLAVWPLDRLVRRRLGVWVWPMQAVIFFLCALGVYLGLIQRFNSWDPLNLASGVMLTEILSSIAETLSRPTLTLLIVGFGMVLWLLYFLFDIWMEGAIERFRARRNRQTPPPRIFEEENWHHAAS